MILENLKNRGIYIVPEINYCTGCHIIRSISPLDEAETDFPYSRPLSVCEPGVLSAYVKIEGS